MEPPPCGEALTNPRFEAVDKQGPKHLRTHGSCLRYARRKHDIHHHHQSGSVCVIPCSMQVSIAKQQHSTRVPRTTLAIDFNSAIREPTGYSKPKVPTHNCVRVSVMGKNVRTWL